MKKFVRFLLAALLLAAFCPASALAEEPTAAPEQAKYVDFDNMTFWVNGQPFTLGVSTLQDMIDAGVAFHEVDLEDANNNLRKNLQSEGFTFDIGANSYATVKVLNDTDKGKRLADCVLSRIFVSFSDHPEEMADSILTFAFPYDMTKEQLIENAGDPDDTSHYDGSRYTSDTIEYKRSGHRYLGYNRFTFVFHDEVLDYFYIEYLP